MNQDNRRYRAAGFGCLLASALFSWWGIWRPLAAIRAHEAQIALPLKIFLAAPGLAVFGIFFLIGGARWQWRNPATRKFTMIGWLLLVVTTLVCLASFYYFEHQLDAMGYDIRFPDGATDK